MSGEKFDLLIDVSTIHSEKVRCALKEFLVEGYSTKEVCDRNGVSRGYFSSALGRLYRIDNIVAKLNRFYS
ncbi:transcriptional regulator [Escherichia coli]|nr:transcriptional regulator [Escherichia coli]